MVGFSIEKNIRGIGMIISNLQIQYYNNQNPGYIYIYICIPYPVPVVCPLFWWLNPPKTRACFNQNKGHLGSRYTIVMMCYVYMDVSENNGTPKSSILIGISIINHPFWGTTILGNPH